MMVPNIRATSVALEIARFARSIGTPLEAWQIRYLVADHNRRARGAGWRLVKRSQVLR